MGIRLKDRMITSREHNRAYDRAVRFERGKVSSYFQNANKIFFNRLEDKSTLGLLKYVLPGNKRTDEIGLIITSLEEMCACDERKEAAIKRLVDILMVKEGARILAKCEPYRAMKFLAEKATNEFREGCKQLMWTEIAEAVSDALDTHVVENSTPNERISLLEWRFRVYAPWAREEMRPGTREHPRDANGTRALTNAAKIKMQLGDAYAKSYIQNSTENALAEYGKAKKYAAALGDAELVKDIQAKIDGLGKI
ncbi:MAG: hypothetical protein Q7T16_00415 [Candidatus Burarchaeum sp.]|nr:hypothetical protein [Candidatus Burarchaeum sp.]MDO8339102.1 hypothetical protein [Candidatus Burarchaeum sp.]